MAFRVALIALAALPLVLTACGNESSSSSTERISEKPVKRVDWEAVPSQYHPSIDEQSIQTLQAERITLNAFGFADDVELIYSNTMPQDSGRVRFYKVWAESASWGSFEQTMKGNVLALNNYGMYQCSIQIKNGQITALKGGCYVKIEIILPVGAKIEVLNNGRLISKRFIPITANEFLEELDDAFKSEDKLQAIENFLSSYNNIDRKPALTTEQLQTVMNEFMFDERFAPLRRLHSIVTDPQNLKAMLDREFSFDDRETARQITGY